MEKKKTSVIKNNLYFLKLVWEISPMYIVLNFLMTLFNFADWVFFSVIFMQFLFGDGVGSRSFESVLLFIGVSTLAVLFEIIYSNWHWCVYLPKADARFQYKLKSKLFKKAQSVDLSCYEDPEFYNSYTKAATEACDRAYSVVWNISSAICSLIASSYVIITMVRITPWSILFVAMPLLGNLYFGKKLGKTDYQINTEATPDRRRMEYVNRIVYFRQYAGELRLTNIYSVLEKMFKTSADSEADIARKHGGKRMFFEAIKNLLVFLFGYQGMWLCAAILALTGHMSLGGLIVILNAIVSSSWMLVNFERSTSQMSKNAFFIDNLKTFLSFKPAIDESASGKTPPTAVETLEFKNVSFSYKGQERLALDNISLVMQRGIRHALVGINGSGKSTLIKLMMRYYDPTEGQILLNGTDIREFDVKKYRSLIGAAFQDFALFSATVSENVLLKEVESEADRETVIEALKQSDVYEKIESLERKEESILTREFDNEGVELSGGERQKLVIARAFAKKSPIVILDEPSSALDPIAEYKMFETVTKLCKGENKLSVIVSHRLSSAAMCEKLFVLKDGRLIEEGSHRELLDKKGFYADMFLKQARNYTAGEVGLNEA